MVKKNKTLLIVDDSDIDREILKNIVENEFNIMEADGGYPALEILLDKTNLPDAVLLDVSMPVMDGFGILQILKDNCISIPVFLVTAEATRDNVEKATQFNVTDFIRKPFERADVLRRLRMKLGIVSDYDLSATDIEETLSYISDLKQLYDCYLANSGQDSGHYKRITDLMSILLNEYALVARRPELDKKHIEIISNAGYFCDIGNMVVSSKYAKPIKPEEMERDGSHAILGANIIQLNYSENCEYFVQICSDICMHHHERYDGKGFPHKILGDNNLVYTQICRLADKFDALFFKYNEHSEAQFEYVLKELSQDEGAVSTVVFALLSNCKWDIICYYSLESVENIFS